MKKILKYFLPLIYFILVGILYSIILNLNNNVSTLTFPVTFMTYGGIGIIFSLFIILYIATQFTYNPIKWIEIKTATTLSVLWIMLCMGGNFLIGPALNIFFEIIHDILPLDGIPSVMTVFTCSFLGTAAFITIINTLGGTIPKERINVVALCFAAPTSLFSIFLLSSKTEVFLGKSTFISHPNIILMSIVWQVAMTLYIIKYHGVPAQLTPNIQNENH